MKSVYISLLYILIIQIGCSQNSTTNPIDDFENKSNISIKAKVIKLKSDTVLNDPRTITVFDSLAILNDNTTNSGFALINLKQGVLIKRFAFSGNGKNEFNINALILSKTDTFNEFTIFQANVPNRVFKYDLNKLLKSKNYQPNFTFQFPTKMIFDQALLFNDSCFVGSGSVSFNGKIFGLFEPIPKKLTLAIPLPKNIKEDEEYYSKEIVPWTISSLNGKVIKRPNENRFAFFSNRGAVVSIADVNSDKKFKSIFSRTYYLPRFHVVIQGDLSTAKLEEGCKYGFMDVTYTKDFIYALYNDKIATTDDLQDLLSNIILVYDWNGNPVRKILLDRPCYSISIDNNKPTRLYALSILSNDEIYQYTLTTELK